ncbi:MFS transporter [Micromonospora yasonensis]|uniref:MFS transporter n=1 Tax=Micromonospora yasonensis TaxID=1128667 RepID=UPI00223120A4|nr:MFS transporter [Micromonospora yasonensis]MCW3839874.1 MFS transporter [Micromonospora yasonensis]
MPAARRIARRRPSRDSIASAGGAAVFSCSLGIATVALPLLALRSGYSPVEVGVLTAISAVAQMATRLLLGAAMRLVGDWVLVLAAAATLCLSNGLLVGSTALLPFALAELLQGIARACFWTGSQTHVVRGDAPAVGGLAMINFVSSLGLLAGPVVAGLLVERSPQTALGVGSIIAAVAVVPALGLDRLPPFRPPADRPPGRIWRRSGVDVGCWAGVSAGAWRALLSSYVPVALDLARQSGSTIGVLVSVANGASVVGSILVARVSGDRVTRSFVLGTLATGGATGLVALAAGNPWAAGALLAVSGLGAGVLQTIGPAIAADSVHAEERGDAIAVAGTFRAAALFAAPLAVAAAVAVIPLTVAMGLAGGLIAASAAAVRVRSPVRSPSGGPP